MGLLLTVVVAVIAVGFPLLWILFMVGEYPSWRKRSREFDRERRDKRS